MELWQVVLAFVAIIPVGLIAGTFVSYLVLRFFLKDRLPFLSVLYLLFNKKRQAASANDLTPQFDKKPSPRLLVKEQAEFVVPDLLAEFKHNRKIAVDFSGGNLLPLQTGVWDTKQYTVQKLSVNLRSELVRVYTDIRLLNSLVWLSTEFSRRSASLYGKYRELLTNIGERLDRINQIIELELTESMVSQGRIPQDNVSQALSAYYEKLRCTQ